ncbi:hypothetical protein CJO71_30190 [Burkholderia ubonensis]|uniref:Uncharacterized protein n=1 Tax=Burkholderia ubonensis TaxID=101571 RepID=A0AB74DCS8_9BURK|nr:hypothetical protein [Burkholderia ubonensis]PAJ77317.1 hypothetical protein CJO71_30190 [Burkholderia ubonensis]RQP79184.1 hypothetical protein DF015_12310 [Burkholderia ubonensis]
MSDEWNDDARAAARTRYESEFQEMVDGAKSADERALEIASELEELWLAIAPQKSGDDFESEIHEPFDHDKHSVEELEEQYASLAEEAMRNQPAWPLIELPIRISYGYVYSARLAHLANVVDLAWNYVERASFWQGVSVAFARIGSKMADKPSVSDIARAAAHARNSENRAIKESAFEWLNEHFDKCKSKDDAAERLTRIVPVAFRTARRYVTQWHLSRH